MNLIDLYEEPVDPTPPTETDLDEVIQWYETTKEIVQKRNIRFNPEN
jgi:hypothetical protein